MKPRTYHTKGGREMLTGDAAERLKIIQREYTGFKRMQKQELLFEELENDLGYEYAMEIYQGACRKIESK